METLLPRRSPRSDDPERGEPGPPLHPITGTFADATHAKDFGRAVLPLGLPFARAAAGRIRRGRYVLLLPAFLLALSRSDRTRTTPAPGKCKSLVRKMQVPGRSHSPN